MTDTPTKLAGDFPPLGRDAWLAVVDKALKGADFARKLTSRTSDGLRIEPLYTRAEGAAAATAAGEPGAAPFTRGARAAPAPWDIRQIHAEADPARANAAILDDLMGGATSIALLIASPGSFGLPYTGPEFARALEGVELDLCPVVLVAGEYTTDAAGSLMALWRARGIPEDKRLGALGADPLGTLARTGALYHPVGKSLAIAARLAADTRSMPRVTALIADGHPYHAAGAGEAEELAAMLATLVAYLRACEAEGLPPADALPRIAVGLACDADQFLTIAKLRAGRRLVWRVAEACGAGEAAARVTVGSATSARMLARRDPWVNLLRTTMACAAAAIGGADSICVLPFTWALGQPDAFARRMARNTQLVLQEESALGRVVDAAGGSWYVEKLGDDLARKAWELFQEIEGKGGMGAALASGFIQERIAATAATRAQAIATGRMELTGVSAFPLLGPDGVTAEPWPPPLPADLNGARVAPLRFARLAAPFEALRDRADAHARARGAPPRVFLATLGSPSDYTARATWTRSLLASGGIEAAGGEPCTTASAAVEAFRASGARIACLCSSDAVYARLAEETVRALASAGAGKVLLAGRPGDKEAALQAAGVGGFLYQGVDAVEALRGLLDGLGVV